MIVAVVCPLLFVATARADDEFDLFIEALEVEDSRQGAAVALAKHGGEAVPALRRALANGSPDGKLWSAFTLGMIGPAAEPAGKDLIGALDASDEALRAASAQALGKIGKEEYATPLAKTLQDKAPAVRLQAAEALGRLKPRAASAAAALVVSLKDAEVRDAARNALARIGSAATDALVAALEDDETRFDASAVLRKIALDVAKQHQLNRPTSQDLACLHLVLLDERRKTPERQFAAESLAKLDKAGAAVLIEAFAISEISSLAAIAFAHADGNATEALLATLTDERPEVRAAGAEAIEHFAEKAGDVVAPLTKLLEDDDRDVRYRAVRALHELGERSAPAVPTLRSVVLNPREQEPTRQWAIKTLSVTLPKTHDAVVAALIEASKEEQNYGVRQLARQYVLKIDAEAAKAAGIK